MESGNYRATLEQFEARQRQLRADFLRILEVALDPLVQEGRKALEEFQRRQDLINHADRPQLRN